MTSITLRIADDKAEKLRNKARELGIVLEKFLSASIEELASLPEPDFDKAVNKVMEKNEELYKRLAK